MRVCVCLACLYKSMLHECITLRLLLSGRGRRKFIAKIMAEKKRKASLYTNVSPLSGTKGNASAYRKVLTRAVMYTASSDVGTKW